MNEHEADRIAAAMHELRPDWPVSSLRTLIGKHLMGKPRRDVTVALAWVACESNTATPARVLETGPWWRAVAVDGQTVTFHPYDHGTACGICDQPEDRCRANQWSGHEYQPKPAALSQRVPGEHAPALVLDLRDRLAKARHTQEEQ